MRLRKLELKDIPFMLEWMHDSAVNKHFKFDFSNVNSNFVENFVTDSQLQNTNYHFAIVNDEDEYQGTISIKNVDMESLNGEYAVVLRSSAQNAGLGYWSTLKILRYAFEQLCLERVYLNVISDNKHAVEFYKRIGFTYEGCFYHHLKVRGEWKDLLWFRMMKSEYKIAINGKGGGSSITQFILS